MLRRVGPERGKSPTPRVIERPRRCEPRTCAAPGSRDDGFLLTLTTRRQYAPDMEVIGMRRRTSPTVLALTVLFLANASSVRADDDERSFRARLVPFEEVPSVSSTARGSFKAWVSRDDDTIEYDLRYEGIEGTTVVQSHIHLGQRDANGGVSAFLCGGGGKDPCPASPGRVHGFITAENVIGPGGQGIAAGELDELLRAMRAGVTYANVHTDKHPSGELRGQIRDD